MTALYVPISEQIWKLGEQVTGIDYIFTLLSWALMLIAGVGLYMFAVTKLMPGLLLSPTGVDGKSNDRGVKKYVFPEGRAVVYELELGYRQYVSKYMLFAYKGNKYAKLKFCEGVKTVECEIALYDNSSKLIKIISAFCIASDVVESQAIELPAETSYARVLVRGANGVSVSDEHMYKFSPVRIGMYAAITTALTVVLGYFTRIVLVFLGEIWFAYAQYATGYGLGFSLIVSVIFGLLISFIGIKLHCNKKIFKVKK